MPMMKVTSKSMRKIVDDIFILSRVKAVFSLTTYTRRATL